MDNFSILWDTKVKALARKCVNSEFISLAFGNRELTPEELLKAQAIADTLKDPYGMYYISDMIWRVEHALADNRTTMAQLAAISIYETISSDTYWPNIFNNDLSSEEAQNIKALQEGLAELIRL